MKAMVLEEVGRPLVLREIADPEPGPEDVLLDVHTCGVCRTDLHIVDGELADPKLPLVPGHQVIGRVRRTGSAVTGIGVGQRVGVPWLGGTCGGCGYCRTGRENLCDDARFTGYHRDGGFATLVAADHRFCFPIPRQYVDLHAAPLLCAGLIGFRALRMTGAARRVGLYGFGSAAHIVTQIATHEGREIHAFTRPGDTGGMDFARRIGAGWAGGSDERPPERLDAAIIFAPVGALVPAALQVIGKGGTVVCAGIHMSDIPSFPYELLWGERVVRSVANLTREDGVAFFEATAMYPVRTEVTAFPLEEANEAIERLRSGAIEGAAVLQVD